MERSNSDDEIEALHKELNEMEDPTPEPAPEPEPEPKPSGRKKRSCESIKAKGIRAADPRYQGAEEL